MKFIINLLLLIGFSNLAFAQNLRIKIEDKQTNEALIGATVRVKEKSAMGGISDANGMVVLKNIPNGKYALITSMIGYDNQETIIEIPNQVESITIQLVASQAILEEVTVSATRTNSRIEDLPIKVEVLGQEDMDEESSIVPSNVSSILGDISIIHIQRTSVTSGNQAIRMQGLDPKYTQILRDGLPLFEGFSGNLGVLAIPPLDLKQVEVIKGSVSTLYGGGAIGGMINLVSKSPTSTFPQFTAVINRTTLKEDNVNVYYAQKYRKTGLTLFAGLTHQQAVDVNKDQFSDSPLIRQYTFHPKFFVDFNEKSKLNVGYSYIREQREGGFLPAIENNQSGFVSNNQFQRHTIDFNLSQHVGINNTLTLKGSDSFFDRILSESQRKFGGKQNSSFAELSNVHQAKNGNFIIGVNFTTEDFKKNIPDSTLINNYYYQTIGFFTQADNKLTSKISLQTGLRFDIHNKFGSFFLPRISLMAKPNEHFTVRWSYGMGYKTPNIFSNLTPNNLNTNLSYWALLPLDASIVSEKSEGSNIDVAFQKNIGELSVQLDQAFYYTHIKNAIVAQSVNGKTHLQNADYIVRSIGTDTYLRMTYHTIELYIGYNHTLAQRLNSTQKLYLPFSPQDKFSLTMAYEIENKWRFGIESSWVGNQYLFNNQRVRNYWFWAAAIERKFGKYISLVVNGENLSNFRQSDYESIVSGNNSNPSFSPIWGSLEGRVLNLSLKFKL